MDLSKLEEVIIKGKTNTTAYYILKYLQEGKIDYAKKEYFNDGDKLTYPYYMVIEDILGCRLHLDLNCKKPLCKYLKKWKKEWKLL